MEIPGYQIERKIGQGGMAMVYLAVQQSLERRVALKILNPMFADAPEFTQRFLNEGRMLASVAHTNVITIHDIGVTEHDVHYIAMEYVEGRDLRRRMCKGLEVQATVEYLLTLSSALDYAHQRGIVHRDIKPSNVLFRADGTLLLSDFGIAKQMGVHSDLTVTGSAIGSPHYLSPEQARGQPVDTRADIYSLGVMLHEMLTGKKPYAGASDLDTMMLHVNEPIPTLPEPLLTFQPVLDRMMAKQPDGRFDEVTAMADALQEAFAAWSGTAHAFEPTLAATRGPTLPGNAETLTDYVATDTGSTAPRGGVRHRAALVIGGVAAVAITSVLVAQLDSPSSAASRAHFDPPTATASLAPGGGSGTPPAEPGADAAARAASPAATAEAARAGGAAAGADSLAGQAPPDDTAVPGVTGGARPAPAPTRSAGPKGSPPRAATTAATAGVLAQASEPASAANGPTVVAQAAPGQQTGGPTATGAMSPKTAAGDAGKALEAVDKRTGPGAVRQERRDPALAEAAREAQLSTLLAAANEAIADFRLTTPKHDNALTYIEQILRIDSSNKAAREAFSHIAERYAVLARASLRKNDLDKAALYVARGLEVDANNVSLAGLRDELAARRRARGAGVPGTRDAGASGAPASSATTPADATPGQPDFDTPSELFGRIKRLFTQ